MNIDEAEETNFAALIRAICNRILPSGDGPGAEEAGVATYVEKVLQQARFHSLRELMEQGFEVLDGLAEESFEQGFAFCTGAQQDEILREFQQLPGQPPRVFMRQLVGLCLEAFLSDPTHGGNRDALGWRTIGYRPKQRCNR